MRAASARSTDCFSTDKQRTSSWMWLGSCFRIHTLLLEVFSCQVVYVPHSSMQWPTAPRHEWLLTVWAVFVCSGSAAAGTLCTWKERGRKTARQREYVLAVPPDNKVAGHRKKKRKEKENYNSHVAMLWQGNHGLQQGVCVLTCRVWCMECEGWMWKLLDREQQCGAVC